MYMLYPAGIVKMIISRKFCVYMYMYKWVQDVSAIVVSFIVPVRPHFIKTFRPWFYLCCFMCYL